MTSLDLLWGFCFVEELFGFAGPAALLHAGLGVHSRSATTKKNLVHCIYCEHSHLVDRCEHPQYLLGSEQRPAGLFAIQQ